MRSHEVDYQIFGHEMQLVEVELDPEEGVIAEAGTMTYMEEGIDFETKLGDGSDPHSGFFGSIFGAAKRKITGESLFTTRFTNRGESKSRVGFSAPFPGTIVPLNLAELGGEVICQKDSFLCAALGTQLDIKFHMRLGTGFFGGEGFILQRLRGDGMAFIQAGGTVIKKELRDETLRVDTGCLVGFTDGIDYDIQRAGGLKSMIFGGEGIFLASLQGTGTVLLQSLPFSRMADLVLTHAPQGGGKEQGEE